MKRTVGLIVFSLLIGVTIVGVLAIRSNSVQDNGFNRSYKTGLLTNQKKVDLKYNSWYIAGSDSKFLYLGNYGVPTHIRIVNLAKMVVKNDSLILHSKRLMAIPQMFIRIDSPYIYLFSANTHVIFRATLNNLVMREFITNTPGFLAHFGVPISNTSFLVKTYDTLRKKYILSKIMKTPPFVAHNPNSLSGQVDGIFGTEGRITYDPTSSRIIFNYLYRNEFISLDTSLNIINKGHTIDTNSLIKIHVGTIKSKDQRVLSKPETRINVVTCIYGKLLFVNSKLKASNENPMVFKTSSNIDVYDLSKNVYRYSFYIPDVDGSKVTGMLVHNNSIYVMQGQYLTKYQFDSSH